LMRGRLGGDGDLIYTEARRSGATGSDTSGPYQPRT
jgi:hypothetical protein